MAKKKKQVRQRRGMRLLPITVTMLSLLFIIKANELYLGSQQLREMYGVRDASAEEKKAEEKSAHGDAAPAADAKKDEKAADAAHGEPAKEDDAKAKEAAHGAEAEKPKEEAHGDTKKDEKAADASPAAAPKEGEAAAKEGAHGGEAEKPKEDTHGEAKKEEGDGHGGASKPAEEPRTHGTGKRTVKEIEEMKAKEAQPRFTKTELDLLQNLSKRREELDAREKELELKSKILEATDKRITDKISEMKVLEADLSKVLAQYNEKQDAQIKSLVKIYEGMKPDEAAAIFNELEMPILLEVISKMSERKVAPVLANMSPKRARDVTQELAEKRKKSMLNAAATTPPVAAPKP